MFQVGDWIVNIHSGNIGYVDGINTFTNRMSVRYVRDKKGNRLTSVQYGDPYNFILAPFQGDTGKEGLLYLIDLALDTKDIQWAKTLFEKKIAANK
ncbi:hypothetical protein [Bacillus sp. 03113]|uniref:hypothetical protein n=1 Tax=Bacillus sp. 03113 TaxID=2578211 RepID=UPI001144EE73|nr:hypothetical protein [Bacillus sp. 03113]